MKREAYIDNPYKIIGIDEKFYTTKEDESITMNPDTGEYFSMRKLSKDRKILHDSVSYTKVFQNKLHVLVSLSPAAMKLFMYSACMIRPFSEVVILNPPDCAIACSMSVGSVYEGVKGLLDKDVVRKKLGSSIEFWFDPNIFFNGNRVKMLKHK
jgi:hypothetical protein